MIIISSDKTHYGELKMDQHTYDNWVKVKETFEESGNTNNFFYKRALQILATGEDPLKDYLECKQA